MMSHKSSRATRTSRPGINFPHYAVGDILKQLEPLTASGVRPGDIFTDWVKLSKATLEALPGHFEAALQQQTYTDTPETTALFERLRKKYQGSYWDNLCQAFALLWGSTEVYQDVLGDIYMNWGWPNTYTAQYFTPFPVAKMMAVTLGVEEQVEKRLKEAIYADPLATAAMIAGYMVEKPQDRESWMIARVIPPALAHYQPVTVSDPTCGSGVMFLAVADCLLSWATQMGLVQFYGQDIDPLCVLMCQTNILLYGLNGVRAKQLVWLAEQTLAGNIQEVDLKPRQMPTPLVDPHPPLPLTPVSELVASLPPRPVPSSSSAGRGKQERPEQPSLFNLLKEPTAVYMAY